MPLSDIVSVATVVGIAATLATLLIVQTWQHCSNPIYAGSLSSPPTPTSPSVQHQQLNSKVSDDEFNWPSFNTKLSRRAAASATFYMASSELDLYLRENAAPMSGLGRPVTNDDLVVVLKTTRECQSRIAALRATWMNWAKHVFIISDKEDQDLGIMTFPASENFTFGGDMRQGRHFYQFIGFLWSNFPHIFEKPYFLLCDDDTWVNIPHVLRFLQPYDPALKVMFTGLNLARQRTDGCDVSSWVKTSCAKSGIAWGGGGAGSLFTRHSMRIIASMVRSGACPWLYHDDLSLARCAASGAHIVQVLNNGFDMRQRGHDESFPPLSMFTIHKVCSDCKAKDFDKEIAQMKRWSCSSARRYKANESAIPECANPDYFDPDTFYGVTKS